MKTAEELWDKYETLLPENALDEEGCETGVTLTREQRSTDVIYYDDFFKALTEHDNEIKAMINGIENIGIHCIEYVGSANYHERESEAKKKFRKALTELRDKL